jgi:hypothetical protein
MLKTLLVIQKINENGKVEIFQAFSDSKPFQWTFESKRKANALDNLDYFPFTIRGIHVEKRTPGPETETKVNNNLITFCDDYGIPDGSVIAVLFPENFIPDIIKFKDNPYIPVGLSGQVITRPPAQIQVLYNKLEKRCAIVLHIHENLLFGIKCIAKKVIDENFPQNENRMIDELFDISISRQLLNVDAIRTDDLKIINDLLNKTDLNEINNSLNEILEAMKAGEKSKAQSLLSNFSKLIINGTGIAGNLTKILDSYYNGGPTFKFIGKVIEYITL